MLTTFVCTNCSTALIFKILATTAETEYLGIDPCKCKGDPTLKPKKETNVTSLTLYREKRGTKK